MDTDPAARLAVHVSGTNTTGEVFEGWIHCAGQTCVRSNKRLVDRLEGNPVEYSMLQPCRKLYTRKGATKNYPIYIAITLDAVLRCSLGDELYRSCLNFVSGLVNWMAMDFLNFQHC
jgi:hypothetical protein